MLLALEQLQQKEKITEEIEEEKEKEKEEMQVL